METGYLYGYFYGDWISSRDFPWRLDFYMEAGYL
jgi:hypothetical protein